MEKLRLAMAYVILGAPVWAWLLGLAVFALQEVISRSKRIKALTYAQALGNGAAWLRGTIVAKLPIVGLVLRILGALRTPGEPTLSSSADDASKAAGFLPLLLLPALLCSGCPGAGGIAKQIAYDSAACAVGQVPAAVQDTVGQATLSLTGAAGAPSWGDFAQGDLLKYGINAAICIVEAAIHDIDAATAGTKGQIAPAYVTGHQRAVDWLAQHGVKHDHAGTMHARRIDARLRAPELFAIAEVCDNRTDHGSALCRPVDCGDEDVACVDMALSSGRSARIHDGASGAPLLVFLDKEMAPKVVQEQRQ